LIAGQIHIGQKTPSGISTLVTGQYGGWTLLAILIPAMATDGEKTVSKTGNLIKIIYVEKTVSEICTVSRIKVKRTLVYASSCLV